MASNFTLTNAAGEEVPFLDPCNGHPSPGPVYAYHYHGLPPCVTEPVDRKNGPSHIIGVAFPHGIYHYVVLDIPAAKSSIDCFRGEVASLPGPKGTFRPSSEGGRTFLCGLPTESGQRRR